MNGAVLFRADGGLKLGLGHITRCLALAEGLRDGGVRSVLLLRSGGSEAREVLEERGLQVEELPQHVTWDEDAAITLGLAKAIGAKVLVTDLCSAQALAEGPALAGYHGWISSQIFTACIAAGTTLDYPAQVVMCPYAGSPMPTDGDTNGRTMLVGPSYFIFRREFRDAARVPRSIVPRARRVLVTMGGSDEMGVSARVVAALGCLPFASEVVVRLILGPAFPQGTREAVDRISRSFVGRVDQVQSPRDMAAEMLWADLAVTADGGTRYECAVTGTPCVTLGRRGIEGELSRAFASAGSAVWVENADAIESGELGRTLAAVLEDQELRSCMSRRGRELVDGQGVERVLAVLPLDLAIPRGG